MLDQLDERLFLGYVEGDLSLKDRRAFEQQMADDPRLKQLVSQIIADRQLLRESPRAAVPEQVLDVVEQRLERQMLLGDGGFDDGLGSYSLKAAGAGSGSRASRRAGSVARVAAYGAIAAMLVLVGGISFYLITETHHLGQVVSMSAEHEATFQEVLRRGMDDDGTDKAEALAELAKIAENARATAMLDSGTDSGENGGIADSGVGASSDRERARLLEIDRAENAAVASVDSSEETGLASMASASAVRQVGVRDAAVADAIATLKQAASQSVNEVVADVTSKTKGHNGHNGQDRAMPEPELVIDVVASRPDVSERLLLRRARHRHWGIDEKHEREYAEPMVRSLADVVEASYAGYPVREVSGVRVMLSVPRESVTQLIEELQSATMQLVTVFPDASAVGDDDVYDAHDQWHDPDVMMPDYGFYGDYVQSANDEDREYYAMMQMGYPRDSHHYYMREYLGGMGESMDGDKRGNVGEGERVLVAVDIRPMHFDQAGWLRSLR